MVGIREMVGNREPGVRENMSDEVIQLIVCIIAFPVCWFAKYVYESVCR